MISKFADIAFNLPFEENALTYSIPFEMEAKLQIGMRVDANLRNKKSEGIVIAIHSFEPKFKTSPILRIIDKEPVVNQEQLDLALWMKDYYLASLGECIYKMIPTGRRDTKERTDSSLISAPLYTLNDEQEKAYQNIKNDFGKESIHLLYGITGSGKTEVYIHLISELLKNTDKGAILLVPEISLTIQIIKKLEQVFGNQIALLHSSLKISSKFRAYMALLRGEKRIAVGTRSAIFSPVKNLGLVILDEEHDGSYKEHSTPRYHARQIALQRCKTNQAVMVLGSATPSVEVFYHSKSGKIKLNTIKKRAGLGSIAKVTLQENKSSTQILSADLDFKIRDRISKKEQVILLLNRRGHSPLLYSKKEKKFVECPNCSSNLCFHSKGRVICHLCGYKENMDQINKRLGEDLELQGTGTQKLEEYILEHFHGVRLERLDQDSVKDKTVMSEVIGRLIDGEIDILTGTQMISKGLDASQVTLVGVLNAGIGLGLPDFRANERVFSLLTQVAGRAGRSGLKGEVVIQSNNIEHPVIQLAVSQNYDAFYESEIHLRHDLRYPPFTRIIRLLARSKSEEESQKCIQSVKLKLDEYLKSPDAKGTEILGPAPCPFYKIDNNFRNHIIIKTLKMEHIKQFIKNEIKTIKQNSKVYLEIDFDPMDLV